jgi:lipopolysaccharide transport system ATP-binding protein
MKPAISVQHLSKRFPLQRAPGTSETFLALDDLSFDIAPGQAVGIVGNNGAGKSTLLKILARILPPTSGRAELRGRVGCLLEAGAGFHPELSGRENIFLAGAMLGMKTQEIRRQLDAIVEFSGVSDFLDSPVKQYSSGMYMRLAFSVAAHIQPEILLVDEVLAVGDVQFQKKCLERMATLGQNGETILFVSHSMTAVARLCRHALWLDRGRLRLEGPVAEVVAGYLKDGAAQTGERLWPPGPHAPGDEWVRLRSARVSGPDGRPTASIDISRPFTIDWEFDILRGGITVFPTLRLFNEWGTEVLWTTDTTSADHGRPRAAGRHRCRVHLPANLLSEGFFSVTLSVVSLTPTQSHFAEDDALHFQATESIDGTTARGAYTDSITSAVRPLLKWSIGPEAPHSL